jgi:hypothetical protein
LEEAIQEAELAIKFLDQGLYRNASGKVFQAWKALMSAATAKNRKLIAKHYTGVVKDGTGRIRSRADLIIALMPTTRLREVASILVEVYGKDILHLTDTAINIHEFRYNGLDPEGIISRYTNLNDVEKDIKYLTEKIIEWVRRLSQT